MTEGLCTDTNIIEKHFREARKITLPESSVKFKGGVNLIAMRQILKHWDNPSAIDPQKCKKSMIPVYRGYVRNFLLNKGKCPKRYHTLIQEYKDFVLNCLQGNIQKTYATVETVLNCWNQPISKYNVYRTKILDYYAGDTSVFPVQCHNLLESYRPIVTGIPAPLEKQDDSNLTVQSIVESGIDDTEEPPEFFVSFIEFLKEKKVKEFTIRF